MRPLFRTVVCLCAILSSTAIAQTDARPQFDVASIKPAAPDARGMYISPGPGGGININNMPLRELIVIVAH